MNAGVGLFLNTRILSNNSRVNLSEIGEGSRGLFCLTDRELCCTDALGPAGHRGLWRSSNGSDIIEYSSLTVYRSRGLSSMILNRRSGAVVPAGVYTCLIPDGANVLRTLSVLVNMDSKLYVYM